MAHKNSDKKKKWLGRYRHNMGKIDRLSDRLKILDQRITGVRSPNLSGMPRGGTPVTTADLIGDKIELEARIKRLQNKGVQYRREILEPIDDLSDETFAEILENYYIRCLTIEEIADQLQYSERHVWRLFSQAIEEIEIESLRSDHDSIT